MKWMIPRVSQSEIELFCKRYAVEPLVARLFLGRNIDDPQALKYFLNEDLRFLHNPFLFSQMDLAVERIQSAVQEGEKVLVYGDRDTDGITATVLMVQALRQRGLEVFWELPMGDEHYGLDSATVAAYAKKDVSLIITVDCGIGNRRELMEASALGMDAIVIDHHNTGDVLPEATAIINPKVEGEAYPFEGLSAVALVAKVGTALDMAESDFYNQTFCLLNLRPGNESIILEAVKLHNLVEQDRITETFVSNGGEPQLMQVADFLRDQVILVYQKDQQEEFLKRLFGGQVDIGSTDIAPEVWKQFPALKNKSLLWMLQGSKLNRFSRSSHGEIDAAVQLLISLLYARNKDIILGVKSRLDLVALGLIADMMPLLNENRIMVRHGLRQLEQTSRKGLKELVARMGLLGKDMRSTSISWKLTPSINATGRMGQPDLAARLLLEEGDVVSLADDIVELNEKRKELGNTAWTAILPGAEESLTRYSGNMVVVQHHSIYRGITGILAGRLSRHFNLPAMVVATVGEQLVGSVRSSRDFHVTDFLARFEDMLQDFGGHDAAGGFHLQHGDEKIFFERLAEQAQYIELSEDTGSRLEVDLELDDSELSEELESYQKIFEPVGMEFGELVYAVRSATIDSAQVIGKDGTHLKLLVSSGRRKWPAVYWSAADRLKKDFDAGSVVDCAFKLARNYYGNNSTLQLNIVDICASEPQNRQGSGND